MGGEGSGLYEMASSIHPPLNRSLLRDILEVAKVRNNLAHDADYVFSGDEAHFAKFCNDVLLRLQGPEDNPTLSNPLEKANHSMSSDQKITWVTFQDAKWGMPYASNAKTKAVHLNNDTPLMVVEDGTHYVLWRRAYNRIGFVTMGPRRVPFDLSGRTTTQDQISFRGSCSLQLAVLKDERSIMDMAQHPDDQVELMKERVLVAFQSVAGRTTYETFNGERHRMMEDVLRDFRANQAKGCAFSLEGIFLTTLEPMDEGLRKATVDLAQISANRRVEAERAKLIIERVESEGTAKITQARTNLEIEYLAKQQELKLHEQALAIRHNELKMMTDVLSTDAGQLAVNMDATHNYRIKLAEIERLVAELRDNRNREITKALLNYTAGQNNVLRSLADNQYGINVTDGAVGTAIDTPMAGKSPNQLTLNNEADDKDDGAPQPPGLPKRGQL